MRGWGPQSHSVMKLSLLFLWPFHIYEFFFVSFLGNISRLSYKKYRISYVLTILWDKNETWEQVVALHTCDSECNKPTPHGERERERFFIFIFIFIYLQKRIQYLFNMGPTDVEGSKLSYFVQFTMLCLLPIYINLVLYIKKHISYRSFYLDKFCPIKNGWFGLSKKKKKKRMIW